MRLKEIYVYLFFLRSAVRSTHNKKNSINERKKRMFLKLLTTSLLLSTVLLSEASAASHGRAWSSTNEGKFSASVHMGIMPATYMSRKTPNNTNNFTGTKPPEFSKQFKMPTDLVGELGYIVKNNLEVFYNFDWSHAGGKTYNFRQSGFSFSQKFSSYNAYGNYLGTRYYFTFRCSPVKPFVGAKIGVLIQNGVNVNQTATFAGVNTNTRFAYFGKKTSLAGGLQVGVDWQLLKNLSLVFKAEAVASFARKGTFLINRGPVQLFKVGSTGGQFSFPITLGVKFTL